jgi:hypothetical protein
MANATYHEDDGQAGQDVVNAAKPLLGVVLCCTAVPPEERVRARDPCDLRSVHELS